MLVSHPLPMGCSAHHADNVATCAARYAYYTADDCGYKQYADDDVEDEFSSESCRRSFMVGLW